MIFVGAPPADRSGDPGGMKDEGDLDAGFVVGALPADGAGDSGGLNSGM